MLYSDELYHYGVRGMKWGKVRRTTSNRTTTPSKEKYVDKRYIEGKSTIRRSSDDASGSYYLNGVSEAHRVDYDDGYAVRRSYTKDTPNRNGATKANARPGNKNSLDAKTGKGVTPKKATSTGGVNATQIKRVNLDNYRRVDTDKLPRVDLRADINTKRNKPATPGVNAAQKSGSKTSSSKKTPERKNTKRIVKIKR